MEEQRRLAALYSYNILDTSEEQAFDDLVRIASHICQTPISLISLIDSNRQWFKARIGMEPQETHRDIAFCAEAIKSPDLMVVEDATNDPRFQDNPLVIDDPEIRFYAGAPLLTPEGHALGTLCVIDHETRKISEEQRDLLQRLARQVMNQMELRRRIRQEKITSEALQQSLGIQRAMFDSANLSIIATDLDGIIQTFNQGASRMLGYEPEEVVGKTDPRIFHDSHEIVRRAIQLGKDLGRMIEPGFEVFVAQCRETKHADEREWTYIRKDGTRFPVLLSITPVIKEDRIAGYLGIGRDLTETNRLKEERNEMSEEILRANKLLEAELEEASIRHKHLVEASPEMIFSMELDGTIRSMNQRIHGLLGYNADEVVGQNILDLLFSGSSQFNFEGELLLDRMKNMADGPGRIEMSLPFETRAGNLIELYVTLDYVSLGWPMVFGRAIPNQEDVLSQYVLSSSRELQIGNDIQLIDEISKSIAEEASRCLDEEERMGVTLGIREMLMNAIEHGNLGITFEEKSLALEEDRLFDLIRERQKEASIRQKRIRVGYTFNQKELSVHIEDEGQGFDTEKMLNRNIKDVVESRRMHGRGIRITKEMFDEIRYTGKGNRVILRKLFE
ncbi:MAG: PAS domain S-box protein [Leptospiraceae bacterium]|nr:PAS domain S-box protein [Leptospiraceae bacterium]